MNRYFTKNEIQLANKQMKDDQHHHLLGKFLLKSQLDPSYLNAGVNTGHRTLLVKMQNGSAILENTLVISY